MESGSQIPQEENLLISAKVRGAFFRCCAYDLRNTRRSWKSVKGGISYNNVILGRKWDGGLGCFKKAFITFITPRPPPPRQVLAKAVGPNSLQICHTLQNIFPPVSWTYNHVVCSSYTQIRRSFVFDVEFSSLLGIYTGTLSCISLMKSALVTRNG